jgi:hypothetical protein
VDRVNVFRSNLGAVGAQITAHILGCPGGSWSFTPGYLIAALSGLSNYSNDSFIAVTAKAASAPGL